MQATYVRIVTQLKHTATAVKNGYETAGSWRRMQRSKRFKIPVSSDQFEILSVFHWMGICARTSSATGGQCSNFMELSIETTKEPVTSLGFPTPAQVGGMKERLCSDQMVFGHRACGTERSRGSSSQEKSEGNLEDTFCELTTQEQIIPPRTSEPVNAPGNNLM